MFSGVWYKSLKKQNGTCFIIINGLIMHLWLVYENGTLIKLRYLDCFWFVPETCLHAAQLVNNSDGDRC